MEMIAAAIILSTTALIIALVLKPITVTIVLKKTQTDVPKEYNESLADLLPPEVQQYYKQHTGGDIND